ncbi:MAG TPA: hypothetical protein VNQ79_11085 [Blastocatellia bacterium]|nr:hypothetical protein [Blastocatellia bacterium]
MSGDAGQALTPEERQTFDAFRTQSTAALQPAAAGTAMIVSALQTGQPLVFDIVLERR